MRSILNLSYKPKSFCREYVEIKRDSNQLIQFMATVLGIKKSYDDWFSLSQIEDIESLCKEYNLYYKFDWIFMPCKDVNNVIGGDRLPTTRMFGFPFEDKSKGIEKASVHVFFSKSKENLELSFRNGWYPLIIKNRAIHKPYIDILRFGYFLGYPHCCIDFFRRYNNHFLYNYLFEVLRNTKMNPHAYCNPLLKDHTFSYIYHMPCSYDCETTINYVSKLRKELGKLEPELVELTDSMLAKPFLVFREQNAYIFEGEVKNNSISYSGFAFLGNNTDYSKKMLNKALTEGNRIIVAGHSIAVYEDNKRIYEQKKAKNEGFIIKFGIKNG